MLRESAVCKHKQPVVHEQCSADHRRLRTTHLDEECGLKEVGGELPFEISKVMFFV